MPESLVYGTCATTGRRAPLFMPSFLAGKGSRRERRTGERYGESPCTTRREAEDEGMEDFAMDAMGCHTLPGLRRGPCPRWRATEGRCQAVFELADARSDDPG